VKAYVYTTRLGGRKETLMKRTITYTSVIFVALAIVFAILAVIAKYVFAGDVFTQALLLVVGATVFGSGFTLFLIKMFSLLEKRSIEDKKIFEVELRRG
jgi:hypothetical protein